MFIGRTQELARLRDEFAASQASLLLIYGRRRVGKSALLREATKSIPRVLYQATRVTTALNLEGLKEEIARSLGVDNPLIGIGDWLGVLTYLARKAETTPGLVVVLDEFPYLADTEPALPSIVQKFWDSGAPQPGRLKLVLCGSMIAHMEDLLAERNPLYSRKTLALDVGPLPLRDATRFFPGYSAEEKLVAYAIFGGIPFYLQLCNPALPLDQNVKELLLTNAAPLVDEPTVLLQSELREIQRYASILAAIADGCTKLGEITGRVRDIGDSSRLTSYMERLQRMRLVRAVQSMDAGPKSRDRRYFITDSLMSFWHRFVRPNMSSVTQGFGSAVWQHRITPHLDKFMRGAFEEICREHARSYSQERLPAPAQEIGQVWGADYNIDLTGQLLDRSVLYGECRWSKNEVGEGVLDTLIDLAQKTSYGRGADERHFVLYARSGFKTHVTDRVCVDARIVLHTPQTMLGL
jgi:uncharacterized protein